MRHALLFLLVGALSGCGLFLDGIYLVSDKRFTRDVSQTRPTELTQQAFEHSVRAEQGQVWLACEDTERTLERAWTVRKTYETVNGWHLVHLLPVVLDTLIGGALGIGFGISCGQGGAPQQCLPLLAVAPLALDAAYSAVRLATIEPPKLVNKTRLPAEARPSQAPNWRKTVACEPDAVILVGRSEADPVGAWFRVDAWGAMDVRERPRLISALLQEGAQVYWAGGGKPPVQTNLNRCEVLKVLGSQCPQPPRSR